MSEQTVTRSWHIEFKSGASTRIDDASDQNSIVSDDTVELFNQAGARIFAAPFSGISYMKVVDLPTVHVDIKKLDPEQLANAIIRELKWRLDQ